MKHLNIYNPSQQTKKELVENFIIRINEFEKIYNVIKTDVMKNAPQHFIIQGVRGSGKTTLLLRIFYEITENNNLCKWLIPIRFNEEQYGISKLYKLWENISKELENTDDTYLGLLDEMQKSIDNENYEEYCYNLLFLKLKENGKKLIVFIDNIGDRLDKFTKKELQRLREVLITNNNIRLIGSSSVVLESTYNYKEAFYDFFKIINLNELKKEETKAFLLQLDKENKEKAIEEIINKQPGRIEALRILTGGVPRTMVLLYEIFIKDSNGDSFHNLEELLDSVTPLYKHRMDDLSTQQQEIVDVIALNWDAIPVKDIVRKTRMESKAVSSQLNLLEKNNIIIKKATSTKNNFYQLKERFFNIWYLMRNGRNSDKSKVKWLVKFLEIWCNSGDLENMIKSHIQKLKSNKMYDKYAYHVSEAYAQLVPSANLQKELLDESRKYLTSIGSELICDISESDVDYLNKIDEFIKNKDYQKAIKKLLTINSNTGVIEKTIAEIYDVLIKDYYKAEKYYLMALEKNQTDLNFNLALLYKKEFKDYEKAKKYYLLAIKKGYSSAMYNLALLYDEEYKDFKKSEKYYLMAIGKGHIKAMNNLAFLYDTEFKDYEKAEKYYLKAIENGNIRAMNNLAFMYFRLKIKKEKALKYSLSAYKNEVNVFRKQTYAIALFWNNNVQEANEVSQLIFENEEFVNENIEDVKLLLTMLIAKKQYNFTHKLFEENKFNLKDKYKPIYYALMSFMKDSYPDEMNKMGEELKDVVDAIIKEINQTSIDYA